MEKSGLTLVIERVLGRANIIVLLKPFKLLGAEKHDSIQCQSINHPWICEEFSPCRIDGKPKAFDDNALVFWQWI